MCNNQAYYQEKAKQEALAQATMFEKQTKKQEEQNKIKLEEINAANKAKQYVAPTYLENTTYTEGVKRKKSKKSSIVDAQTNKGPSSLSIALNTGADKNKGTNLG